MKIILLILILKSAILFGQDTQTLETQIQTLIPLYNDYSNSLKTKKKVSDIENQIQQNPITISNINFIEYDYNFQMLPLDFFNTINKIKRQSIDDKKMIVDVDLAKLNASSFILSNISHLSKEYSSDKQIFFKELYRNSELKLLDLAKQSLYTNDIGAEILDIEYNLIIRYLSSIPFPVEYSFYRRRMLFTIANPQAAKQEIQRINQQLLNIN